MGFGAHSVAIGTLLTPRRSLARTAQSGSGAGIPRTLGAPGRARLSDGLGPSWRPHP